MCIYISIILLYVHNIHLLNKSNHNKNAGSEREDMELVSKTEDFLAGERLCVCVHACGGQRRTPALGWRDNYSGGLAQESWFGSQ